MLPSRIGGQIRCPLSLVYALRAIIIKTQEGVCFCSHQEADTKNGKVKEPKSQNVFGEKKPNTLIYWLMESYSNQGNVVWVKAQTYKLLEHFLKID